MEYRSERDKFKMLMPPTVGSKPSAKGRRYEGRDERSTLLVMVGAHDLAADMSPEVRKAGATLMLEAFRNTPKFKLSAERQVPFAGQTATEMVLDGPEERDPAGVMQKTQLIVRAVIVGNKLYTVVVGSTVASLTNTSAIFDTFQVLP